MDNNRRMTLGFKEYMYKGLNRCETFEDLANFFRESADKLNEIISKRKELK